MHMQPGAKKTNMKGRLSLGLQLEPVDALVLQGHVSRGILLPLL
jgi:hypothetical protein